MGVLHYGNLRIEFDDRTLAHLHVVICGRLRLDQPFFLSWKFSVAQGSGRGSIWLSRGIPVSFTFDCTAGNPINKHWLKILHAGAMSTGGLVLMPEPDAAQDGN